MTITQDILTIGVRTLLGQAIEHGIPEPEVFEPDILLTGKVHQLFNKAGGAKTWLGLWLTVQAVGRGQTVLYLDMENGHRLVSERLQMLSVDTSNLDALLHYYPFPKLSMEHKSVSAFDHLLKVEAQPDLIVFDSWVNFLAGGGLDENSNTDVANWSIQYLHPARSQGITTVVLDHMPHDGDRSRGASRKKDEVDVQWKVETKSFDRQRIGEISMTREKDREGYLPKQACFKAGGDPFIFDRTDAVSSAPKFSGNAKKLYELLKERGERGAKHGEIKDLFGGSTGSASNAISELQEHGLISHKDRQPYYLIEHENLLDVPNVSEVQ